MDHLELVCWLVASALAIWYLGRNGQKDEALREPNEKEKER